MKFSAGSIESPASREAPRCYEYSCQTLDVFNWILEQRDVLCSRTSPQMTSGGTKANYKTFAGAKPALCITGDLQGGEATTSACSRESWSRSVPSSSASRVGYDPRLEFGSFHPRTAPSPAPGD